MAKSTTYKKAMDNKAKKSKSSSTVANFKTKASLANSLEKMGVPILQDTGPKTKAAAQNRIFTSYNKYNDLDPYNRLIGAREYLFFTRPDLHIMGKGDNSAMDALNPDLADIPFFIDLQKRFPHVIKELQYSTGKSNKFMYSLTNRVNGNLDLPSLTSVDIDNPANIYGADYEYRGSSESSDDNHSFSLEFEDTKYADIYMLFKTYDIYEQLKRVGRVAPTDNYIRNKVLHDQISVFKFIVDEDLSTIIHFSKLTGVFPVSLPRDAFSTSEFTNGLTFSVNFKAAFVEDMEPLIITDFNALMKDFKSSSNATTILDNGAFSRNWAKGAYITTNNPVTDVTGHSRNRYKFLWKA